MSILNVIFEGKILPLDISIKILRELLENIENLFVPIIQEKFPNVKKEDITISPINLKDGSLESGFASAPKEYLILTYQNFYEISKKQKLVCFTFKKSGWT